MALLTLENVSDAVALARPTIQSLLAGQLRGCETRDAVSIFVLDPEKLSLPAEEAVLWRGYVGISPGSWERPFDEFALNKAKLSQKRKMDTLDVIIGGLLEEGDIVYPGGIYRQRRIGGKLVTLIIGVSGHMYAYDIAIAEMLAGLCFAQMEANDPTVEVDPTGSAYFLKPAEGNGTVVD